MMTFNDRRLQFRTCLLVVVCLHSVYSPVIDGQPCFKVNIRHKNRNWIKRDLIYKVVV